MFNLGDKIAFHIVIYDKNNRQLIPFYVLGNPESKKVKLPKNTNYVELKEYTENLDIPSVSTIRSFYLGKISTIRDLIKLNKKIIVEELKTIDSIDINVIIEETEKEVKVKKILTSKDLVFESVEELEDYLKRLSEELYSFKQKETAVKRLLKNE